MKKVLGCVLFLIMNTSHSGTVGLSGVWNFHQDHITIYDPVSDLLIQGNPLIGEFDFDSGIISFDSNMFLGIPMNTTGIISDNLDGTYSGVLNFDWNVNLFSADILWEITETGSGIASVVTLDGDLDGLPGTAFTEGPFTGFSMIVDGNLIKQQAPVPVPAAVWLFASGVIGLFGFSRRKIV